MEFTTSKKFYKKILTQNKAQNKGKGIQRNQINSTRWKK